MFEHDLEKIGSAVSEHSANFMCIYVNEYSNIFGHCVLTLRRKNAKNECWKGSLWGQCLKDEDVS